jgi:hypothetical protein
VVTAIQVWNPDDWEALALSLLQSRHGALNVHKIPAAHKGDLGIDYYCTSEAVAYQCYAVVEPIDIATRAERQKKKITADTKKLIKNNAEVKKLFLGKPVKHWRLLVPLHDSKDVNLHCASKTTEIQNLTSAGPYGTDITFGSGLTVIWADNTKGKSTCMQGMLYVLGMERMLSPRREVPLPHAMTSFVETDTKEKLTILESNVSLEIENGEGQIITVHRPVKSKLDNTHIADRLSVTQQLPFRCGS